MLLTHLSAWISYRKIEPFEWTTYMDSCVSRLRESGVIGDAVLVLQVQCHLLSNPLVQPQPAASREPCTHSQSAVLLSALLRQLESIKCSYNKQVLDQGRS